MPNKTSRRIDPYRLGVVTLFISLLLVSIFVAGCRAIPGLQKSSASQRDPDGKEVLDLSTAPYRLVGYYASWNVFARQFPPSRIPAGKLTHVNYAFASLNENGQCVYGDPNADPQNISQLNQLKRQFPHLKTLISIGGEAESFSQAASTAEGRLQLAGSCVRFMQDNGFDGIDLDWEYPQREDSQNYSAILEEIRRQLDLLGNQSGSKHYLLTVAVGASPYQYHDIEPAQFHSYLDWLNIMTYDFHGPWSGLTGFNSPLYASSGDLAESEIERNTFNINAAALAYIQKGVPSGKLVIGAPFYARSWGGVPAENNGLYQPFKANTAGTYDYWQIREDFLIDGSGYARHWDAQAQVPWLYNPATQTMISYEDPLSIAAKAEFVRQNQLGGIMVWQLGQDDRKSPLLDVLSGRLLRRP